MCRLTPEEELLVMDFGCLPNWLCLKSIRVLLVGLHWTHWERLGVLCRRAKAVEEVRGTPNIVLRHPCVASSNSISAHCPT